MKNNRTETKTQLIDVSKTGESDKEAVFEEILPENFT